MELVGYEYPSIPGMLERRDHARRFAHKNAHIQWSVDYYDLFIDLIQGKTDNFERKFAKLHVPVEGEMYLTEVEHLLKLNQYLLDHTAIAHIVDLDTYDRLLSSAKQLAEKGGDNPLFLAHMARYDLHIAVARQDGIRLSDMKQQIQVHQQRVRENHTKQYAKGGERFAKLFERRMAYFHYLESSRRLELAIAAGFSEDLLAVIELLEKSIDQTPSYDQSELRQKLVRAYVELLRVLPAPRPILQKALAAVDSATRGASVLHNPGLWRDIHRLSADAYEIAAQIDSSHKVSGHSYMARRSYELSIQN